MNAWTNFFRSEETFHRKTFAPFQIVNFLLNGKTTDRNVSYTQMIVIKINNR